MDPNFILPLASSTLSFIFFILLIDQLARASTPLPARLGSGHAVVCAECWDGVDRQCGGLVRAALQDLVPHRRHLGGGLAGPGHRVPAGQDALRVCLRLQLAAGGPLHVPDPATLRLPPQWHRTPAVWAHRTGARYRRAGALDASKRVSGDPLRGCHRGRHRHLGGDGRAGGPAGARVHGRSGDAHPDR